MERTNPLFEREDAARARERERDASSGGASDALRRARAGTTMEVRRRARDAGVVARETPAKKQFVRVNDDDWVLEYGRVEDAGREFASRERVELRDVARVERFGGGAVIRLLMRDGGVVELTGKNVEDAAMFERGFVCALNACAMARGEGAGDVASLCAVGGGDDDDAESNLDDSDDDVDTNRAATRAPPDGANGAATRADARAFVPELVSPVRSAPNDGHVLISVSPSGGKATGNPNNLGVPSFHDDDGFVNASKSTTRRPLLQSDDVDNLAATLEHSARFTRCDISDIGSERSSDKSDFSDDDDDGGSSWGGSNAGDPMVIEAFSRSRHGRVKELQKLFARGVDPRVRDGNGLTLLHIACQNNQRRSAKLVLKQTDYKRTPPKLEIINSQTNNGHTPLHFCFAYGYEALGEYLLSLGASDRITNIHGLSCYEGLEPNETRETLNNPDMKQRAHEARMQRWIESQRPGAMPDAYPRAPASTRSAGSDPRRSDHGGRQNYSEPGDYVSRSRSASEYSDDRSHASYDSFGVPRSATHGYPGAYGPPPPQPYAAMPMPYAVPYAAPMMPVHAMYMQYPGMPPPMHYGAYDDRDYRSPPRRRRDSRDRRSRSRSRGRYRSRSRDHRDDRRSTREYDRDRDYDRDYDRRRRDDDERRRSPLRRDDERHSRRSSRARSLGDPSDDGASSLGSDGGARRTPSRRDGGTPSQSSRRKPAKVDVLEVAPGGVDAARRRAGVYDDDSDGGAP